MSMHQEGTKTCFDSGSDGPRFPPDFVLTDELQHLLDRWERSIERGLPITPEELCPDQPQLASQLRACIRALETFTRFEADPPSELSCPDRIGPYRVIEELARGGSSVIYLVEQSLPKRRIALKLLNATLSETGSESRFHLEVHVLAALNHPGIAQIYDAGVTEIDGSRRYYFTMEWIDGENLGEFVRRRGEQTDWTAKDTVRLCLGACDALRHAHAAGVVHRDLKPGNVMVSRQGVPKVIDFGIARVLSPKTIAGATNPTSQQWAGTRPYMSPEQFGIDETPVDARTDIYSMAVVIYQLLTGRFPYPVEEASTWKTADVIRRTPPTLIGRYDRRLGGDLEVILDTALAKAPNDRYASMADFADDLTRFLDGRRIHTRRKTALWQLSRWGIRHPFAASAAACTFLFFVLLSGLAIRSNRLASQRNDELVKANHKLIQADQRIREQVQVIDIHRSKLQDANADLRSSNDRLVRTVANRTLSRLFSLVESRPDYVVSQLENLSDFPQNTRGFTWRLLRQLAHRQVAAWQADPNELYKVILSPQGETVISSGRNGIFVWDVQSQKVIARSMPGQEPLAGVCPSVDWDRGLAWYVSTENRAVSLNVSDNTTAFQKHELDGHVTAFGNVPGSEDLLIADDLGFVEYRNTDDPSHWRLQLAKHPIVGIQVDSTSERFAAVSTNGELVICELEHGTELERQKLKLGHVARVKFSPSLDWALCAETSENSLLWNVAKGEIHWRQRYQGDSPDLDWIRLEPKTKTPVVCVSRNGRVELRKDKELESFLLQDFSHASVEPGISDSTTFRRAATIRNLVQPVSVDVSFDARRIAIGRRRGDLTIRTVDAAPAFQRLPTEYAAVNRLSHSRDGRWLAVSGGGGGISIFDQRSGESVASLAGHGKSVRQMWFDDDGSSLSVLDQLAGIANWNLESGLIESVIATSEGTRQTLAIDDDRLLGWGTSGPEWLSSRFGANRELDRTTGPFYCADFHQGSGLLATADSDGHVTIRRRDGSSWQEVGNVTIPQLENIAIDGTGDHIVTCESIGNVMIWKVPTLELVTTVQPNATRASCIAFSPDGTAMATGHFDGEIQVWDTVNWEPQVSFDTGLSLVRAIQFSPDGERLVAAGKGSFLFVVGGTLDSIRP